jgi:hypothetical protein
MIRHIVMWKLKDFAEGASREENARRAKAALEGLGGRIPGLLRIEAGVNFTVHEAAWDLVLFAEFAGRDDLEIYLKHPEHAAAAEFIGKVRDQRAVVDYEV